MLRSASLNVAIAFSLWCACGLPAQGQSSYEQVVQRIAQLDRAVCLQQWKQAIGITGELIASPNVSAAYRQELLNFRRQLQAWQVNVGPLATQASCDRALPLVLTLAEPEPPPSEPLDWNRALIGLANPRPIIELDHDFEPTDTLIPPELITNSPDILANVATPIDTADGFNVLGGRLDREQQIYSFLARLGDRLSLHIDVTRIYAGNEPQLFLFDQTGRLLTQRQSQRLQASIQDFVIPKTDVYFAVVSPQGTTPILDAQERIVAWQTVNDSSFGYTLTLTGITPYQGVLLPQNP